MEKTTGKVTKRTRYEEVLDLIATASENGFEGFDFEGLREFCLKEIDALDRKAEKAKETAAKKKAESDELTDIVLSELTDELEAIADIVVRVATHEGYADVTGAKVSYRLNALAKDGKATKGEVVIPATETTKKRTVVAYSL